jgi:hypothetical protein
VKRFVYSFWGVVITGAGLTLAVVAITEASAGATYLIALGYGVIAIPWMSAIGLFDDEPKAPTGEARSKGSR